MQQPNEQPQPGTTAEAPEQQNRIAVPDPLPRVEYSTDGAITLQDIANAITVIDFAATQGAFKDWGTVVQVMTVRERLYSFLEKAVEAQRQAAEKQALESVSGGNGEG